MLVADESDRSFERLEGGEGGSLIPTIVSYRLS
jgi:hypothetical protein